MALSNSYNYTDSVTAANVIALALRRLGVYDPAETINSTEEANALQVLNLMVKEWSKKIDIVARDTAYLFLTSKTKTTYTTDSDYVLLNHTTTTLAADAAASASTITCTSAASISNGHIILIKLDDNTIHATTVNGAPAGAVVTLTTALPSAASSGNYVYNAATTARYTHNIPGILSARSSQSTTDTVSADEGGIYTPMEVVGDTEFHNLSMRVTTGRPLKLYHRPQYNASQVDIWPCGGVPDADRIELVIILPMQDLDATTNNFVLPPGAFNALGWNLAAEMASEYGLTETEQRRLWTIATAKREEVFDDSVDEASVIFERE